MQQNQPQNLDSLLLRIFRGNENAFEELLEFYDNQLNDYIMGFTKSQSITEEIVQDVFLKIWLNRTTLTEINFFKSYLFVIARNHTLDCLKQINRRKKKEKEWINTIISQASIDVQESSIDESHDKILEGVRSLPCQQRKVYLLRNKGLKQTEIARELNISVETVKKHSMLAKRFLKRRVNEYVAPF